MDKQELYKVAKAKDGNFGQKVVDYAVKVDWFCILSRDSTPEATYDLFCKWFTRQVFSGNEVAINLLNERV